MRKLFVVIVAAVMIAGCKGGGSGGIGSLFGSGSSESSGGSGFSSGGSSDGIQNIHNPEPSSMALLGVGLAGLVISKLRKKRRT